MSNPGEGGKARLGLIQYIQNLVKKPYFPSIDEEGRVYTFKGVGRASKKSRIYHHGIGLRRHLKNNFPGIFIHRTSSPTTRALGHKSTGQTQFSFTDMSLRGWDIEQMSEAAIGFEIPEGMPILLLMPEIFQRDILEEHPEFCFLSIHP